MQVFSFAQLTLCKIKPFVTENDVEMYKNKKISYTKIKLMRIKTIKT